MAEPNATTRAGSERRGDEPAATESVSRGADEQSLTGILRDRTQSLHIKAERSGVIRRILRGQASRFSYAVFLRNLLPAYKNLEDGLERHRSAPGMAAVAHPPVFRAAALASDLESLAGPQWRRELPLLPAGKQYAERIAAVANGDGVRLIAHAYTRYMGDLSGGQILRRVLARSLGVGPEMLRFYDFAGIADLEAFKADYRTAIDRAGLSAGTVDGIVDEARLAFRHNIAVSLSVQSMTVQLGAAAD